MQRTIHENILQVAALQYTYSVGVKWQMDVKHVPTACYSGFVPQKFYQFIYPYMEQSGYSTVDFLYKAIAYFGYKSAILQTDNGSEFTYIKRTNSKHTLDITCEKLNIKHQKIRPRTPRHNGKVERSHHNGQERFYNHMSFYNYEDLKVQIIKISEVIQQHSHASVRLEISIGKASRTREMIILTLLV